MIEMIITEFNVKRILIYFLINFVWLLILLLIMMLRLKIKSKNKNSKNVIKIIFAFFVLLLIYLNRVQILYVYDYNANNLAVTNIDFDKLSIKNHSDCFINNDTIYYFDVTRDKREMLEEYFVGHNCTIEYYKWSKMVWKIKLIE